MTLAKLKGKIFGKIMSDDKKEKLQQMIKDKGIAAVAKMFGLSNRELEAIAESKEGVSVDELKQAVNAAIAMFKRSGRGGEQIIPSENFDGFNDNEAMAGIRYWGNWENPQDAYDEEDYDQQDPTDETYENATKLIAEISKQFPNIEFELMIEEKNTMLVSARHKVKESTEISESINDIIYLSGIK